MRWTGLWLWCALGVACGGVSPRPEEIAAELPPERTLDAEQRARVAEHTVAALGHLRAQRFHAAVRDAEAALALDPRAARARAVRARCTMEEARRESPPALDLWRRAEGELRLAERLQPADPEIALLHAELLEADGHLSAATAVLARALEAHPEHVRVLREASRLRYELGEERAAVQLLERLCALAPDDHRARYRLARCRLRLAATGSREADDPAAALARFETAAASFRAYKERVPDDAEAWSGEAFARLELVRRRAGDPDPAELAAIEQLYERAGELAPASPEPEHNLGVVRELRGDADGARRAYEQALQRDPEHLPSLLNLAAMLARAGRTEEAVVHCRLALRLQPTDDERLRLERFVAEHGADPVTGR